MIENERKYVIRPERFSQLLRGIDDFRLVPEFIRQTYVDAFGRGRVRKSIRPDRASLGWSVDEQEWRNHGYDPIWAPASAVTSYTFTYKNPMPSAHERFEVEFEIDEPTYEAALIAAGVSGIPALFKLRFSDQIGPHRWDTDLFYERMSAPDRSPGFVLGLAEVEMPAGEREPPELPDYLAKVEPILLNTVMENEFTNLALATSLEQIVRSDVWRYL